METSTQEQERILILIMLWKTDLMLVGKKIHDLFHGIKDKPIPVSSIDKIGEVLREVQGLACRMIIDM